MRYLPHILFAVLIAIAPPVTAADLTWDPSGTSGIQGGSGTWDTTLQNWTSDGGSTHIAWTNSSPTNTATFGGDDGTYTVTLSGISRTDGLTFNASGYTLEAASALTVNIAGGIIVASGKSATIGNNVALYRGSALYTTGGGTLYINTGGKVQGSSSAVGIQGATVIVNGGTYSTSASQNIIIGNSNLDPSTLTILSGTANGGSNAGSIGVRFSGSGTVNLDGGKLTTSRIFSVAGTSAMTVMNFNGGLLQASGTPTAGTDFLTGITSANVKEGGAQVDTQAFDIAFSQALLHGGAAARDGGLTKSGAGVLTLKAVNTYTGDTTVSAGTLLLADNAGLTFVIGANGVNNQVNGTGSLTLEGDFTFDLSGAGTTVGNSWLIVNVSTLTEAFGDSFNVNGFTQQADIWSATVSGVDYEFSEATGRLSVVPEPKTILLTTGAGLAIVFLRRRRQAGLNQ